MAIQQSNILTRGRNRRNLGSGQIPVPTGIIATGLSVSTVTVTISLSVPASLRGVPQYLTTGVNGALPVSATLSSPQVLVLTYAADQTASTLITVPANDPAVRSYDGGYVQPTSFDPSP